jgi:hypothetical protein
LDIYCSDFATSDWLCIIFFTCLLIFFCASLSAFDLNSSEMSEISGS